MKALSFTSMKNNLENCQFVFGNSNLQKKKEKKRNKANKKEVSTKFCLNPACPFWWVSNTRHYQPTENAEFNLSFDNSELCLLYPIMIQDFSSFFSHYLFAILKPISPHFCNPEERLLAKKKVETKNSASLLFFQIFFGPCECISTWLP